MAGIGGPGDVARTIGRPHVEGGGVAPSAPLAVVDILRGLRHSDDAKGRPAVQLPQEARPPLADTAAASAVRPGQLEAADGDDWDEDALVDAKSSTVGRETNQTPEGRVRDFLAAKKESTHVDKEDQAAFRQVFGNAREIKTSLRLASASGLDLARFLKLSAFGSLVPITQDQLIVGAERFLQMARFSCGRSDYQEIRQILQEKLREAVAGQQQENLGEGTVRALGLMLSGMLPVDYLRDVSKSERSQFQNLFRQMVGGLGAGETISGKINAWPPNLKKQFWRMALFCLEKNDYAKFKPQDIQQMMEMNASLAKTGSHKRWKERMSKVAPAANKNKFHEFFVVRARINNVQPYWEPQKRAECGIHAANAFLRARIPPMDCITLEGINAWRQSKGREASSLGKISDMEVVEFLAEQRHLAFSPREGSTAEAVIARIGADRDRPVTRVIVSHYDRTCPYPNRGFESSWLTDGHFTALVKKDGGWWMVDSKGGPKPVSEEGVKFYLRMAHSLTVEADEAAVPVQPAAEDADLV